MGIGRGIGIGLGGGMSWSAYWATREPSGASASITGSTTATVTWTDSAVAGADGYKIYAGVVLKATVAVGVQTANVTGLTEDTQYIFKVVAYKGTNESTGATDTQTTFMSESQAYFDRMTSQLSDYRKSVINIYGFKTWETGGYLSKLECVQLYLLSDTQKALLNAIADAQNAVHSATPPTHFPYRGYKGNQSSMYIDSGFDASLASKYLQDDSCIGRHIVELGAQGAYSDFGVASNSGGRNISLLSRFNATTQIAQINTAAYTTADNVTSTPAVGSITLSRALSASSRYTQNQEAEKTNTKTSVARPSGNVYVLAFNNAGSPIQHMSGTIAAFWAGGSLSETERKSLHTSVQNIYNKIFEDVMFTGNLSVIGDSTIALYLNVNSPISYFLRYTGTMSDVSTAGDTIAQQQTKFNALSAGVKSALNYVFVQVGLNDLNPAESAATALGRYQDLIDDINAASASAKIVCGTMTPCKQRLIDVYGAIDGLVAYQKWLDMNDAIKGNGVNAITGVDEVVFGHTALLNDGSGNLAAAYDLGDHIHENNLGRAVIASSWNTAI